MVLIARLRSTRPGRQAPLPAGDTAARQFPGRPLVCALIPARSSPLRQAAAGTFGRAQFASQPLVAGTRRPPGGQGTLMLHGTPATPRICCGPVRGTVRKRPLSRVLSRPPEHIPSAAPRRALVSWTTCCCGEADGAGEFGPAPASAGYGEPDHSHGVHQVDLAAVGQSCGGGCGAGQEGPGALARAGDQTVGPVARRQALLAQDGELGQPVSGRSGRQPAHRRARLAANATAAAVAGFLTGTASQ
jgi:hypothetical protein